MPKRFSLLNFIRALLEPNPVFKRELRARWRRPAAYLTLFFYAAPLAIGMVLFYSDFALSLNPDRSVATVGKELFDGLILAQTIAWLFISAVTAAPAIALERERGLLEALQLANLKAWRIVWGKCLSLFSFQALLFLVPLPVVAICFLFGGVDPKTFVLSTIIIALTALCGTMIGLYFSSARPRPGAALRDGLIFIVIWTSLAALSGTHSPNYQRWPLIIRQPLAVVEVIHPFSGLRWMDNQDFQWPLRNLLPEEFSRGYFPVSGVRALNPGLGPPDIAITAPVAYQLFVAGIGALSLLLYLLTVRATARILPEPEFMRRAKPKKSKSLNATTAKPTRTERVLYFGLPILSQRSFDNPVFGHELRGKIRWRAASPLMWILRAMLLLAPLFFYLNWFLNEYQNSYQRIARSDFITQIALLSLIFLCLYATVGGATVFTRERENNTWENLRLSLLSPGQILHGKVWPLVIILTAFSIPLFVVLSLYIELYYPYGKSPTFFEALQVTALVFVTALLVGSVAIYISWLTRTTQVALGLSLAINAVWLLLFYIIADMTPTFDSDSMKYLSWWNPMAAIKIVGTEDSTLQFLASLCILFLLFVASILIIVVAALMRQKFRDEK